VDPSVAGEVPSVGPWKSFSNVGECGGGSVAPCGRSREGVRCVRTLRHNPSPQPPPRSGRGGAEGLSPPLRLGEGVGGRGCVSLVLGWERRDGGPLVRAAVPSWVTALCQLGRSSLFVPAGDPFRPRPAPSGGASASWPGRGKTDR